MHPAQFALSQLTVGAPQTVQNLSMFPLRTPLPSAIDYRLLGDALNDGTVRVQEVSFEGRVPDLQVENRGRRPVLIVDGEELQGAKQNRVANVTILLPGAATTVIPVSCVEAGRWADYGDEFAASDQLHFASGRAEAMECTVRSLREFEQPRTDQARVWSRIASKADAMNAPSATRAMSSIFERHEASLNAFINAFTTISDQVGGLFAMNGELCGVDVFDKPSTFASLLPKLVRSYAIDALEHPDATRPPPSVPMATSFVARAARGDLSEHAAVGLGRDVRIADDNVIAGGLVVDQSLLHLAAFAKPNGDQTTASDDDELTGMRLHRVVRRRRYH